MKNREAEQAKYIEEMIVYLELFVSIDSQEVNSLRLKSCLPIGNEQLKRASDGGIEAVGRRAWEKSKGDSFDSLVQDLPMLNANLLGGAQRESEAFEVCAIHELWGRDFQRAIQKINASLPRDCRPLTEKNRLVNLFQVPIRHDGTTGLIHKSTWNYVHGNWWVTDTSLERDHEQNIVGTGLLSLAAAFKTTLKKSWAVEIGCAKSNSSVCLLTDPTGVKEWFKLRESVQGRSRRDALLHWVSAHWRQNRIDPDVESYVRQYLRGQTSFRWFNMDCTVKIPESDEDKIAILKHERRVMSILGRDKRPRGYRER